MSGQHRQSGMNAVSEMDLRALLIQGLHELAQDDEAIAECVGRADDLLEGTQGSWVDELTRVAHALLDPRSDMYITTKVGYPTATAHLPCIGIINDQSGEDTSGAVLGDILSRTYRSEGVAPDRTRGAVFINGRRYRLPNPDGLPVFAEQDPPRRTYEAVQRGVDWRSVLEVSCWTAAPETSLLVQAMARWALFRRKGDLSRSGVYEVGFDEAGVQPDPAMEPRVGYVPVIRCTLSWTYGQTTRKGRVVNYEGDHTITANISC